MKKPIRVWFSLGAAVVALAAGSARADEGRFVRPAPPSHTELVRVRQTVRPEYRELDAARARFYRAHHTAAECRRFDRWYGARHAELDRRFGGVHRTW
jgi:hypothetical protein